MSRADVLTDADMAPLPTLVQRYLRTSGVIGQPRVRNLRARMHGRIRQAPDSRWIPFTAEQHNFFERPARLFYMDASMLSIPVHVFHRYVAASATMRARAVGVMPVGRHVGIGRRAVARAGRRVRLYRVELDEVEYNVQPR